MRRILVVLTGILVLAVGVHRVHGTPRTRVPVDAKPQITPAIRAATFRWAGVSAGDQQAILKAIADARPEAQRLIAEVDGLVSVTVGPAAGGEAAGTTQTTSTGYDVDFDLATVSRQLGQRGIDRLVLHELGHVVDFQLVPPSLDLRLDSEIPAGYGCENGDTGGCTPQRERFAESFAKWALNDIGVNLSIGYAIPPPSVPLTVWGAPLAALLPG